MAFSIARSVLLRYSEFMSLETVLPLYATLGSGEVGRLGEKGRHGRSESISSPVRTPYSDRTAATATASTHVQFSGLERISLQLFQ